MPIPHTNPLPPISASRHVCPATFHIYYVNTCMDPNNAAVAAAAAAAGDNVDGDGDSLVINPTAQSLAEGTAGRSPAKVL